MTVPCWFRSKESFCDAGEERDAGSVPGSGRSPGEGNGNPLQYSRLGNSCQIEESGRLLSMGSQGLDRTWQLNHRHQRALWDYQDPWQSSQFQHPVPTCLSEKMKLGGRAWWAFAQESESSREIETPLGEVGGRPFLNFPEGAISHLVTEKWRGSVFTTFQHRGQVSFLATPLPLGFLTSPISITVLLSSRWESPAGFAPLLPTHHLTGHPGLPVPPSRCLHIFQDNRWAGPQGSNHGHQAVIFKRHTFFSEPGHCIHTHTHTFLAN